MRKIKRAPNKHSPAMIPSRTRERAGPRGGNANWFERAVKLAKADTRSDAGLNASVAETIHLHR